MAVSLRFWGLACAVWDTHIEYCVLYNYCTDGCRRTLSFSGCKTCRRLSSERAFGASKIGLNQTQRHQMFANACFQLIQFALLKTDSNREVGQIAKTPEPVSCVWPAQICSDTLAQLSDLRPGPEMSRVEPTTAVLLASP